MEQQVIQGLIARGLPPHVAIGVAGNMAVESAGFQTGINEIAPVVPGSRGGYGLNQWTGPRRRQYEEFARTRGAPLDDLDAQLDFTVWELENTERSAYSDLLKTRDPIEAATVYSKKFLRPGIPHLNKRLAETRRLAGGDYQNAAPSGSGASYAPAPQGNPPSQAGYPQNGLDVPESRPPQMRANMLDPRAFMINTAPDNRLKFT